MGEAVVSSRFDELQTVINRGFSTFAEVGMALAEMRDSQVYKERYTTFEDYCREECDLGRRRAYELIAASGVVENVRHAAQADELPANERQANPLTRIEEPKQQAEAWERAQEIAAENEVNLTASVVEEAVAEVLGETPDETPVPRKRDSRVTLLKEALRNIRAARKECTGTHASTLRALETGLRRVMNEMEE